MRTKAAFPRPRGHRGRRVWARSCSWQRPRVLTRYVLDAMRLSTDACDSAHLRGEVRRPVLTMLLILFVDLWVNITIYRDQILNLKISTYRC